MTSRKHVLALTVTTYGHLIPMLELCRKICKFHRGTFAISKPSCQRFRDREFKSVTPSEDIILYEIDDGADFAWSKLPMPRILQIRNEIMAPAVAKLLRQTDGPGGLDGPLGPVDVILFDMFLTGPVMENRKPGILYYYFNTPAVVTLHWFLCFDEDTPTCAMENYDPFFRLPSTGQPLAPQIEGLKTILLPISQYVAEADGIICNSFREIDHDDIEKIKENFPRLSDAPFYCIGPLMPESVAKKSDTEIQVEKWLTTKKPRSVVYISFGSNTVPAPKQTKQLGKALLALDKSFIWAHREGHEEHLPEEIRNSIPTQFENPDSKFLILPWAPQKAILADPATVLILSHCGWNGTMESLSCGVPMVAWPMFADQYLVGEMLQEKGIGLLVEGTGMKAERIVPVGEIVDVLRKVAGDQSGEGGSFYVAAQKWKEEIWKALAPGGSSDKELQELVQFRSR